ncbi:MAG: L,D-transpeptidase family protein [Parvularculaceae bacterium]|nr:L,D-transpeptidase family protein [Parvularculaceae bacterium]
MPLVVLVAALAALGLCASARAAVDSILIEKGARRMTLYEDGRTVKTYRIALGFSPVGDKVRQGDGRTPEGVYRISLKNPNSQFHLSLKISYPDTEDRRAAARRGVDPGGDIFIHGTPGRSAPYPAGASIPDWTLGCIAVTNEEIEEVFSLVGVGARVEIRP